MVRDLQWLPRRSLLVAATVSMALLAGACGEGLSLVAVDTEATPLPFKTPRVAETSVEPEPESAATAEPDSESETQPAIETDEVDAPVAEDVVVEVEEPTATPAPEAEAAPTATDPPAEVDPAAPTAGEVESWLLGTVENPAARNTALRAHEVSTDLLIFSETADLSAYYDSALIELAFKLNVRSFYGVFAITALPPVSVKQVRSPLFFFEQVLVHESSEDAIEFLETYRLVITEFFPEQGGAMLNAAMPGVFQAGGSAEITEFPSFGLADDMTFLVVEWPVNATASDLSPRMHIALFRQGNVTAAVALGSSDESQTYRFLGIVERLVSRMS